jgi:serine/threonine-protein kinase
VEREATGLLQQSERDHWRTPTSQENIARSYAILGDADKTIPIITNLLSVPYRHSLTSALLRLDPVWDKVRNDPRFQKLASGSP